MKKRYVLASLLILLYSNIFSQDSLYFAIRVDDIQSRNTSYIPKTITDFEYSVNSRGAKVTWLVIPHRLIESQNDDGLLIKNLKNTTHNGNEIGIHGYNHICPACTSTGHEMFCATQNKPIKFNTQDSLLTLSVKLLRDSLSITAKTFVPPGHYCDTNTYQAALNNGCEFLSSTGITKNFIYKNLFNIQQNREFTWQLTSADYDQQLHNALTDIKSGFTAQGYYVLLLHDPFIRKGYLNGIVINWISELLDSLNITYRNKIAYKTISEIASTYRSRLTSVDTKLIADHFELNQNFPNPFNPLTTINVSVKSGDYSLMIFDVLGRKIKTIVDNYLEGGSYSFSWNGMDDNGLSVSSGVYLCQLKSNSLVKTIKMCLLK